MIRNHKVHAIASSLVLLLPMMLGALFYQRLPLLLGSGSRKFLVFVLPLILLATQWGLLLLLAADPGNRRQNRKATVLVFWILPLLSLFSYGAAYQQALHPQGGIERWMTALFGVLFLVVGNLMPKFRPNRTMGIRLPWTLGNEENWNRTHRLGGKVWVAGGVVLLLALFLPGDWQAAVGLTVLLAAVLVPTVYSFRLYLLHRRQGIAYVYFPSKRSKAVTLGVTAVVVAAMAVLLFTGSVQCRYTGDTLEIEASYWGDLSLPYDKIDRAEYRDECPSGRRTNGFGSPRLLLGAFRNDEFGAYTRYTYAGCDACVVLYLTDGQIVVVNDRDEGGTQAIWQEVEARITR